jgi:hypothetical protein
MLQTVAEMLGRHLLAPAGRHTGAESFTDKLGPGVLREI